MESKEKILSLCPYQGPSQGFGKISIPQQYRTACTEREVRLVDDNECGAHPMARLRDARRDTCCVIFIRFFFTGSSSRAIHHLRLIHFSLRVLMEEITVRPRNRTEPYELTRLIDIDGLANRNF